MTTPYERSLDESSSEVVVTVSGEIDWSNAVAALVAPSSVPPGGSVVVDLQGVSYFDSAALSALFRLDGHIRRLGAVLRVRVAAGSPLPPLFEISQVAQVMEVTVV